uniref:Uncharacterized 12.3 kDa protein in mobL 3'region n=1 Tax=Acidithiobacillus ferridurans TaxID=1232575 RepID=YML2_ACIFI|nr:RecName: Full=Uncharacterized 12.3 kDa protein in mobL 3'region; AltName: Full=ORF 4 [Acidithiobacillus ferridurans]CAA36930.1 unnamed protein product [Acidithiobacillus ferridurans]
MISSGKPWNGWPVPKRKVCWSENRGDWSEVSLTCQAICGLRSRSGTGSGNSRNGLKESGGSRSGPGKPRGNRKSSRRIRPRPTSEKPRGYWRSSWRRPRSWIERRKRP